MFEKSPIERCQTAYAILMFNIQTSPQEKGTYHIVT